MPWGVGGVVLFLLIAARSHSLYITVPTLVLFSTSTFFILSSLMVTVQLEVEDRMRGRMSALIGMGFVAVSPVMSVPIGFLSDAIGAERMIQLASLIFGILSVVFVFRRRPRATSPQP
jgi:MFS family permease